jgi:hypothetical protein
MQYCTTTILVNPTVTICSKGIQHNLICIFRNYIFLIFRSSRHFLRILFKLKGKRKANPGAGPGFWPKASRPSWLAAHDACQAERSRGGGRHLSPAHDRRRPAGPGARRVARAWLPVAYVGKGGRRKYEGSVRDARGKEKCATAHRGGRASMRWQSQGWMAAFRQRWTDREGWR